MRGVPASWRYLLFLYAVLVIFYGGWVIIWQTAPQLYDRLLAAEDVLPVHFKDAPKGSPAVPFFDLEGVISWSECAREGVDVYVRNPCDPAPYNRLANYSPLLVDLPFEWIGTRHAVVAGVVVDLLFLLILPFVFRPRNRVELAAAALACTSHATFYAVERANIDVVVFASIALAALVTQNSLRGRMWLYGAALLGALAKYYPLALGLTALRERLRVLLAIAAAFVVVMALFAVWYWPELQRATRNLPFFHNFSDMFGAGALPISIAKILGLPFGAVRIIKLALLAALAFLVVRLAGRLERSKLDWTTTDSLMLLCGAIIIVSCFLVQTNNSYRAIFLMFTIPGLFSLTRQTPQMAGVLRWAIWTVIILLWAEVMRAPFVHWKPAVRGLFVVRELLWWFEIAVLSAVILCFVRQSPAFGEARRMAGAGPPSAASGRFRRVLVFGRDLLKGRPQTP